MSSECVSQILTLTHYHTTLLRYLCNVKIQIKTTLDKMGRHNWTWTRDVRGGAFSRRDEDENPWGEGENLQGGAGQKSA